MEYSLSKAFIDNIGEEAISIAEMTSDVSMKVLLEDSIIAEIPFVSAAVSIYRIGKNVRELHHVRQLMRFINEIENETASDEARKEYLEKYMERDNKTRDKELEYVVLITSQYINEDKPMYLARLYYSYIMGEIDWESFVSYSEVLNRFLPRDIETMMGGDRHGIGNSDVSDSLIRLTSLGLFIAISESVAINNTTGTLTIPDSNIKDYKLTEFGRKMQECLWSI